MKRAIKSAVPFVAVAIVALVVGGMVGYLIGFLRGGADFMPGQFCAGLQEHGLWACAREWQTIVAGFLGLAGGLAAYRGIRRQIDSSERQHWRTVHAPAIKAITECLSYVSTRQRDLANIPADDIVGLKHFASSSDMRKAMAADEPAIVDIHMMENVSTIEMGAIYAYGNFREVMDHPYPDAQRVNTAKAQLYLAFRGLINMYDEIRKLMQSGVSADQIRAEIDVD